MRPDPLARGARLEASEPAHGARTQRLTLEPLAVAHAEGLFAALDDPRVGRYIGGPDVTALPALRERISHLRVGPTDRPSETWLNWAVLLGDTVIGRLEATLHDGLAEIGYVFGPRWWGQGYAREAVAWLVDEVQARGVVEAWATVDPENAASIALLRRVGFEERPPDGAPPLHSLEPGDLVFVRR